MGTRSDFSHEGISSIVNKYLENECIHNETIYVTKVSCLNFYCQYDYQYVQCPYEYGFALQNYIARFGHGSAKLARQAQSKEKTLKKMVDKGLTEKVTSDKVCLIIKY